MQELLKNLSNKAKKLGAEYVEVVSVHSTAMSASIRLGNLESLESAESFSYGMRVIIGKQQAFVATEGNGNHYTDELVQRAVNMAKQAPEDPYLALCEKENIVLSGDLSVKPDLKIYDDKLPTEHSVLLDRAKIAEQTALEHDMINNTEGCEVGCSSSTKSTLLWDGSYYAKQSSSTHEVLQVIANDADHMETDYDYSAARYWNDLRLPEVIGKGAAELAAKRLHAKKVKSGKMPLIFDRRVGNGLLQEFLATINGSAIVKGTSFLKDKLYQQVFSKYITVIDDPHMLKGWSSTYVDAEGIETTLNELVTDGSLNTWILDCRTAKQLGLKTTGHAKRGLSSAPAPGCTNTYIAAGDCTPEEMIADIKRGIYITEIMGHGGDPITGDYSQGAFGFMIENGKITHPVKEITIAGNLLDMFKDMIPANDLDKLEYQTNVPTLLVHGMTVAGI